MKCMTRIVLIIFTSHSVIHNPTATHTARLSWCWSDLTAGHDCPRLTPYFCPRSQQKITIVGAHLEPETPEEEPLFLGVFKPKDGIREKLRETLHNVLMEEMAERSKDVGEELGPSTDAPDNTVTISKNTR